MLRQSGLVGTLNDVVLKQRKPILGICLGAQIIGKGSQEGEEPGLGWIEMESKRFPTLEGFRVPHMMWNELHVQRNCSLLDNREDGARYYFVHSYYMECSNPENVVASTKYGVEFTSVVQEENIIGMQFHPEKSLKYGLAVMSAFDNMPPEA